MSSDAPDSTNRTFEAIVEECLSGDMNAFDELLRMVSWRIYSQCWRLRAIYNPLVDADEVAQEVRLRVWTKLSTLNHKTGFLPWVYTICRNTFFSCLREEMKQRYGSRQALEDKVQDEEVKESMQILNDNPESLLLCAEAESKFIEAYEKLSEEEKNLWQMVVEEGYKGTQASGWLNMTQVQVSRKIKAIRKKLHRAMLDY
jgi:RNA polymerase sigma factor (sigma-70 family)